jgi:hypothetical protein
MAVCGHGVKDFGEDFGEDFGDDFGDENTRPDARFDLAVAGQGPSPGAASEPGWLSNSGFGPPPATLAVPNG